MNTRRFDKLTELYKRASTEFIQEHSGPDFIVSVTNVELSSKQNHLIIFFSVWPDQKERDVLKSLESLKKELRKELGSRVKTKFVPDLEFKLDESEKKRLHIEELLKKDK